MASSSRWNEEQHDTLTRAEAELQRLLDHSGLITTKLRENLNHNKNENKRSKHRNNSIITEEDENKMIESDQKDDGSNVITYFGIGQQPSTISGGKMYEYQIEALNWVCSDLHAI